MYRGSRVPKRKLVQGSLLMVTCGCSDAEDKYIIGMAEQPNSPSSSMPTDESKKKKRTRSEAERPDPEPGRCAFWLEKKRRYCKSERRQGAVYCTTHMNEVLSVGEGGQEGQYRRRIPCPINPNHSIYEDDVKRHVKVCPDKRFDPTVLPCYKANCNGRDMRDVAKDERNHILAAGVAAASVNTQGTAVEGPPLASSTEGTVEQTDDDHERPCVSVLSVLPRDDVTRAIGVVETLFESVAKPLLDVDSVDIRLPQLEAYVAGQSTKHAPQQSAILAQVARCGYLGDGITFVEMGAGKAGLAFALRHVLPTTDIVVVDRGGFRRKRDTAADQHTKRIRLDIKDFALGHAPEINKDKPVVVIGKHLCGACTDFSLRAVLQAQRAPELAKGSELVVVPIDATRRDIRAVAIATCCHQGCHRGNFLGREFLPGLEDRDFGTIALLTSWAVCGAVSDEKALLGWKAKRVLDAGRALAMRAAGFTQTRLVHFTDERYSKENVMILCYK